MVADPLLESLRKKGAAPFDQQVLHPDDWLPIDELRSSLATVMNVLRGQYPSAKLFGLDDWHEHDGYISPSRSSSYAEIESAFSTEKALYDARHGNYRVFRAFYSETGDFLFRFCVNDEDDDEQYPGIWGSFDVSGSVALLESIRARLTPYPNSEKKRLPVGMVPQETKIVIEDAAAWFDRTWAG